MTNSSSQAIFEARRDSTLKAIQQHCPAFQDYFLTRLLPMLQENITTVFHRPEVQTGWSNNNCESLNHVLKMKIHWHPQAIPTLVESIFSIIKGHYTDVERSFIGLGEFRLIDNFEQFSVSPVVWTKKTNEQRKRYWDRFQKTLKIVGKQKVTTSKDGNLFIPTAPAKGKKPGQVKRSRSEKTTSLI